jgi:tetratricopeptide (TPR) repeat protein
VFGGDYETAYGSAQAALAVGETCGDLQTQGRAYNILGLMASWRDPAGGRALLERSMELATQAGDEWCWASSAQVLAIAWNFVQGEFDTARRILDDVYAITTRVGYRWGFAWHWACLGWEARNRGRLDEARQLLARSVVASDKVGNTVANCCANSLIADAQLACGHTELAHSLAGKTLEQVLESGAGLALCAAHLVLAKTEIALGDLAAARGRLQVAVEAARASRYVFHTSSHLATLGTPELIDGNLDVARRCGEEALEGARRLGSGWMQASAERLLGAAAAGRQGLGIVRLPPEPEFWASVELTTRKALGDDPYKAAFAAGAALGTDEVVAYVLGHEGNENAQQAVGTA